LVVVIDGGQAPGMIPPVVVVVVVVITTCCRATVVMMVMGMGMICMMNWFLGLILDPGQTQGYV